MKPPVQINDKGAGLGYPRTGAGGNLPGGGLQLRLEGGQDLMEQKITLKRTALYVSGSSPVNMIEAIFYNEDCIVYDLEDSVPAAEKDAARFLVYNALRNHRPVDKYTIIRVNGIYSEYIDDDLEASVRAHPDAIRIPKVESAKEVRMISERIAEIEHKAD